MIGFNCMVRGKEVFIVTDKKNKTNSFCTAACKAIRKALGMSETPMDSDIKWFKSVATLATLEYGNVNGYETYKISGSDFCSFGFIKDDDLIVVNM